MRIATASALTLRPQEEKDGVDSSSRRIMMEEQFAEAGLHFVGIQEARAPQSEVRAGRRFVMIVAAADSGGSGGFDRNLLVSLPVLLGLAGKVA